MKLCNKNNKIVFQQELVLPRKIHQQSWGGMPFIYSMGDQNQLPCIAEKFMISNEVAKSNTADAVRESCFTIS